MTVMILNPMGTDGWGGAERWFMDAALGLRARGHRVLSVGRPGSAWSLRCVEAGIPTRTTEMRGDLPFNEARAVAFWAREERVDVLLTKLHKGIRISGLAAKFLKRVPVVAFMGLVEVKRGLRYRLTYALFLDRVLTLTPRMKQGILAVGGVPGERIGVVASGVDPAAYEVPAPLREEARLSLGASPGEPLVVAMGRLHEQKRMDLLLDAFARVLPRVPAARLAVVGIGSLREELEAKARALGVAGRVSFPGFRADIAPVLAAGDLFALSSDDEGLPYVVLEAMAAGRAVAATEVGSVGDLVVNGVTGRLVPRGDAPALAAAMAGLLLDDAARARMGAAGRERARTVFPLERSIAGTEEFLLKAAWLDA